MMKLTLFLGLTILAAIISCDENELVLSYEYEPTLRGAADLLAQAQETNDISLLESLAGDKIIEEAKKRITGSDSQREEVFTAIECLRNWTVAQIAGGRNETDVLTGADYEDATEECVSDDFLMAAYGSKSQLTLRVAADLLAKVEETKNLSLLKSLGGDKLIEEAEKRIKESEAQIRSIFEAIECLRNWIEVQIAVGRNETEVLTGADYEDAFSRCVSKDFLKAKTNLYDEYVPSLAVTKAILGQTMHSGNFSDLIALVGPEILELIEKKIDDADDHQQEKEGILKALKCFEDYITVDLLTNSQLNEDDLITIEQVAAAMDQCASAEFKAALGIPDQ